MDSFAYLQLAVACETSSDPPIFKGLNWKKFSSQAYIHLLSLLAIFWIFSIASTASAALRPGDNGEQVRVLQQRLKDLGYFPPSQATTLYYRRITQDAVRRFQTSYAAYGLQPTGTADAWTLYYLGLGPYPSTSQSSYSPRPIGSSFNTQPTTIRTCQGLRFGHKGPHITQLQEKLKDLGYFYGKVDGKYRERTLNAVTRFQQANNLVATGCADQTTLNAIDYGYQEIQAAVPQYIPATPAVVPALPASNGIYPTLQLGSRGQTVRELQTRLANLGFNPGPIDGEFGRLTESALIRFQQAANLSATGVATPNVQFILRNARSAVTMAPLNTVPYYRSIPAY